jgi:hypothetical protein
MLINLSNNHNFNEPPWPKAKLSFTFLENVFDNFTPELIYQNKDDWLDVHRTMGAEYAKLNFNLCIPSFNSQFFNISTSSRAPCIEPSYAYNNWSGKARFDDVRKQLLSPPTLTAEERGIFSLTPPNWTTGECGVPHVDPVDLSVTIQPESNITQATTMDLTYGQTDLSIGGLVMGIL